MAEFLIKREDGRFLELSQEMLAPLVTPELAREDGWGVLRLRHTATGAVAVIDDEMPGFKVWFEGTAIHDGLQRAIVDELAQKLSATSGQQVYVIAVG